MIARDLLRVLAGMGLLLLAWNQLAPAPGVEIGSRPEPVEVEVVSGGTGRLSVGDAAGQVTVLDFFASWCPSCRHSLPRLERSPVSSDVRWISVSVDDSPNAARRAAAEWSLSRPVVFDAGGNLAKRFGIRALPTIVVLRANGSVCGAAVGSLDEGVLGKLIDRARHPAAS